MQEFRYLLVVLLLLPRNCLHEPHEALLSNCFSQNQLG
ncbi:PTS cellobiose transporter subunit IIA [Listeria monocytogenes]|nr:PTS cellobiose transporter subunit IIA [Listeria monocytogenes]GAT38841.1 PTS cellobiose transporter subunit IIA [Listeria monocytogenes]GAT40451.1 PTS cellobiose transporter subunit IIA [Listeria monocytogenes]